MSLAVCPECTGSVSSRALACPHCGYPAPVAWGGSLTLGGGGGSATSAAGAVPLLDQAVRFVLLLFVLLVGTSFVTVLINSGGKLDGNFLGKTADTMRGAVRTAGDAAETMREQVGVPLPDVSSPERIAGRASDLTRSGADLLREGHRPLVDRVSATVSPMERNLLIGVVSLAILLLFISVWRAARGTPPPRPRA